MALRQVSYFSVLASVLWRCWLGGRKGIRPVKNWVVGCCRGCLGWGADLHIAQQMPLPLTISCSSKSRLVLTFLVLPFWYLLTRVVPDRFQQSSKTVVCVCVMKSNLFHFIYYTHTTILRPSWILSGTTRMSRHQKGKTKMDLLEQEIVAVASAGSYANLHLDPDT